MTKQKRHLVTFVTLFSLALVMATLILGCSAKNYENDEDSSPEEEVVCEDYGLIFVSYYHDTYIRSYIMYDPETLVMYALVRDGSNSASAGGLTVLYNADGTPRLYNPNKTGYLE